MSTLRLDPTTGDLDITNGKTSLMNTDGTEVVEETAQRLRLKFKTFLGEWFLDARVGIPYFENFFIKNPRPSVMRAVWREVIVDDEQVSVLEELNLDYDAAARSISMDFTATLLNGEVLAFSEFILEENL